MTQPRLRSIYCACVAVLSAGVTFALPGMGGSAAFADDRPIGLVEYISDAPSADVYGFDYVFPDQDVDLRPNGTMIVAFFDQCIIGAFEAGVVKFRDDGAKTTKGGTLKTRERPCQTAALAMSGAISAAGVSVKRQDKADSLLSEAAIKEITINVERPVFVWPRALTRGEPVRIEVYALEAVQPELLWTGDAVGNHIDYPVDAPALAVGYPYEVRAVFSRGDAVTAIFSIDPAFDIPLSPIARMVPLGL